MMLEALEHGFYVLKLITLGHKLPARPAESPPLQPPGVRPMDPVNWLVGQKRVKDIDHIRPGSHEQQLSSSDFHSDQNLGLRPSPKQVLKQRDTDHRVNRSQPVLIGAGKT